MVQRTAQRSVWTANRSVAAAIGVVFTLIGLLGFIVAPGMEPGSLLGFHVDLVHNLVHLVTGLAGLGAAFGGGHLIARRYNQIFGIVYLLIAIAGLLYPALYFDGRLLGLMHVNSLDHVLHFVVGIIATGTGFFADRDLDGAEVNGGAYGGRDSTPRV